MFPPGGLRIDYTFSADFHSPGLESESSFVRVELRTEIWCSTEIIGSHAYPRKNKPVQYESPETPNKHHLKDFIIKL